MKHCGLVPLMQSEAGACDQENFVENRALCMSGISVAPNQALIRIR